MRSKVLISLAVLCIAASPFVLLYSSKFFYWLTCGSSSNYGRSVWETCGTMNLVFLDIRAIGLALFVALVGCVLIYITTLDNKNKP